MGSVESSPERESQVTLTDRIEPSDALIRRIPDVTGMLVAGVGLTVLIGWIIGLDLFKRVLPGLATMKSNTALCFLFSGLALALREKRSLRLVCAGIVCAVAGLTLTEYISGEDLGLDQLLFRDAADPHTIFPGRMVQATALGFLLSGASLYLLGVGSLVARRAQLILAVCAGVIGVIAMLGYAYNAQQLYRFAGYSSMAVHTAVSFVVLALGLVLARPDGLVQMLTVPGPSSQVMRRLLPMTLLVPAVTGWLVDRGLEQGFYGQGMDLAVLVLAMMFLLAALVCWTAVALNRTDAVRKRAEESLRDSERRLVGVLESMPDAFISFDRNLRYTYINRNAERLQATRREELLGKDVREVYPDPESYKTISLYERVMAEGTPVTATSYHAGFDLWVEVRTFSTPDGVSVFYKDVSDKVKAEEALRESEGKYRHLFENMTEEVHFWQLVRDEQGRIKTWRLVDANPPAIKTWGRMSVEEIRGKSTDEIFGPGATEHYMPVVQKIFTENVPYAFENYFPHLDKHFRFTSVPLGEYFFTTGADITAIKKAELALRESEERLRLLGDNLPESAVYQYTHEPDGTPRFMYFSAGMERLNGISVAEVLADAGTLHRQILPEYMERLVAAEAVSAKDLSDFDMEVPIRRPDGEVRWMRLHSRPRLMPGGSVVWDGVQIDITERKQAEEKIKASLAEKKVLLREIHHRVKNNLQVISSLVSLQADNLTDDRMRDELNDVRDRIRSMALIHEKLYQTSDLAPLNFADYAASLLHSLWRSHGTLAEKVRLNLALKPVELSIEAAVPCGLILNELAGNSLKHAFPGNSGGEVTVTLEHDAATGVVCLGVSDNGVGLPVDLDWRQSRSLGLRLVQILAGQLRGTVETGTGLGTEFQITFSLNGLAA